VILKITLEWRSVIFDQCGQVSILRVEVSENCWLLSSQLLRGLIPEGTKRRTIELRQKFQAFLSDYQVLSISQEH
jgi:hypothetical protein